jgi:CO/xanthine dehydrogenase FAD-binding subunit
MTIAGSENKILPLDEFYAARVSLHHVSLITEIAIPLPRPGDAVAFEKVSRTPADQPIVCAAVKAKSEGGALREVRVALGGVGSKPQRLPKIEHALETQSFESAVQQIAEEIDPPSDFLGSAEYRREMAVVLVRRAARQLLKP